MLYRQLPRTRIECAPMADRGNDPGDRARARSVRRRLARSLAVAAAVCLSCARGGPAKPGIGVLMRSSDDPPDKLLRAPMESAAAGRAELAFADGRSTAAVQENNFRILASRKPKAIAVDPVDELTARAMLLKAKDKGIPIVFFGIRPGDDSMRAWDKAFYVGSSDSDAGATQARILAARWRKDPSADRNRDGKMQIALIAGQSGLLKTLRRTERVVRELEAEGVAVDKLIEESGDGSREAAKETMASAIARFGDRIEAVACNDDGMALGAIEACDDAGLGKGKRRLPMIVGVCDSGSTEAIAGALESGKLLGTAFLDSAEVGRAAISLALALATGADPAKSGMRIQDAKYLYVP
jgi:methyl-galactoside transport system substrate-binding protein